MNKCNTCGRDVSAPWRVYDSRGKVILGCIDVSHSGHLIVPSESAFWHNRQEAKRLRAASAAHLKKLLSAQP